MRHLITAIISDLCFMLGTLGWIFVGYSTHFLLFTIIGILGNLLNWRDTQ